MELLNKAIAFATEIHKDAKRKGTDIPYIIHPLEALSIAATFTTDEEVLSATVLHDAIEDTPTTYEDLVELFGRRVADLVQSESEDKTQSWEIRKQTTIEEMRHASLETKIVTFSDKLSNLRAVERDYRSLGNNLWNRFHEPDMNKHLTYYGSFLHTCQELSGTAAYEEYAALFGRLTQEIAEKTDISFSD